MARLRIMTYNIENGPGERVAQLSKIIRRVQPDILACQEVTDRAGMRALERETELGGVWGEHLRPVADWDPPFPTENVATLTAAPPDDVRIHAGTSGSLHRPVIETRVTVNPELTIAVFNLHLISRLLPRSVHRKWEEAQDVAQILDGVTVPHCVVGDFNAWPRGEGDLSEGWTADDDGRYRLAVRGGVLNAIFGERYVDAWRAVHPDPSLPGATLVGSSYSRVDHIRVSHDLAPFLTDCERIEETASDHHPLMADFTFPEETR